MEWILEEREGEGWVRLGDLRDERGREKTKQDLP